MGIYASAPACFHMSQQELNFEPAPEYFGRRRVDRMRVKANRLRDLIRSSGNPELEKAWDEFEDGIIDFVFMRVGAAEKG